MRKKGCVLLTQLPHKAFVLTYILYLCIYLRIYLCVFVPLCAVGVRAWRLVPALVHDAPRAGRAYLHPRLRGEGEPYLLQRGVGLHV